MASFPSISGRYVSLRLGNPSLSFVFLLLIIVGLGMWDGLLRWLDLTIDSAVSTAIFICLGVFGYVLECRLKQGQLKIVLWAGLGVISLLLLWSLVESWNHIFMQPDSRSYIRNDGYRAPLYPWFIDLLTLGHDLRAPSSFYHGPIGQLITNGEDSPLIWPVRMQKVLLYAAFVTVLWASSRWTGPFMSVVLGLVILFGDFLSEEQSHLLTEPLTQAFVLFSLAAYCQFVLDKQAKYLLILGMLFGLAFLTRPAAGYLILLSVVAGVQYLYWHQFRFMSAIRLLFFCLGLPILVSAGMQVGYQYVKNGVWSPSPVWAEKKVTLALQLAGVDDIARLRHPVEREFLQRSLDLKWKEDWNERKYLRHAFPGRHFGRDPERGHEFMVRNIHVIASPIGSAMAEERNLSAREEVRFKHDLMLGVSSSILQNPQHQAQRRFIFYESLRDAVVWQHRIQVHWLNGMDVVGLAAFMIALTLLTRRFLSWMGLVCIALHLFAIILFCYSNVPTERFTHASEVLFVIGCFFIMSGFLKRCGWMVSDQRATQGWFGTSRFVPLLVLASAITLPLAINGAVVDKVMPDRAFLHGLPIALDLMVRQVGRLKTIQISKALRDHPAMGREQLRVSGVFHNMEHCRLLGLKRHVC
jgi:hypothetical protein